MTLALAAAQLVTVFTYTEGTFLRRNLFICFGISNLAIAGVFAKGNLTYLAVMVAIEGLAFLADIAMRARPVKKTTKAAPKAAARGRSPTPMKQGKYNWMAWAAPTPAPAKGGRSASPSTAKSRTKSPKSGKKS